ncbi:hypothetical protein [Phenylobacterium sp.]|uniref:hypothetical protein n=1 Tax=Phenylobacterium sp. TaxID=1871053 RepID=UPI002FC89CBE
MSLFKSPKYQSSAAPDPGAMENRRDSERRSRLATGGSQSTLLSKAMAQASGQPIATLTGVA